MARSLRILVTDVESRPALAITRSLGSKGHRMIVGAMGQLSLAQTSRYCSESFTYPDPVQDSAGFVQTVIRTIREQCVDVVLPVTEIAAMELTDCSVGGKQISSDSCQVGVKKCSSGNMKSRFWCILRWDRGTIALSP